jgi:hypothetical protein
VKLVSPLFKLVSSAINHPLLALVQMDLAHPVPSIPTILWKAAPAIAGGIREAVNDSCISPLTLQHPNPMR